MVPGRCDCTCRNLLSLPVCMVQKLGVPHFSVMTGQVSAVSLRFPALLSHTELSLLDYFFW